MASKPRVAPLDKQTIPRLGLLYNRTASRLVNSGSQALENVVKVDDLVSWTDCMISLGWIRNTDKEYKQFYKELKALHPKKEVCGYIVQNSCLRKAPTGQSSL